MSDARRLPSLAIRVARVAVTSAALGGLAAAAVAIIAVDRLIAAQADQRLRAATVTLAGELEEDRGKRNPEPLTSTVDDENDEIVTSGIRLAVFERGQRLAGDTWMFAPAPGTCETRLVARERIRACGSAYEAWVLVAAQPIDTTTLYWLYALAALGAVVLGAGTGAFSSIALSRWAMKPLLALSTALRTSRPEAPGSLELGPAAEYEEVEALRTALRDLTARIQELLDQTRRFAADAAHELRTPLTALRAELELLAEEAPSPGRDSIEKAGARVTRLSELVERLLVLALPLDSAEPGFETVALADVIEDVVAELSAEQRARVRLELTGEGLVRADPRLLTSLVANAVENAFKFAPSGHVVIRVDDPEPGTRDDVVVHVRDSGPGVPPALRERVFEPFYRAKPGDAPGHGLGLALIGHIARAHGGSARFEDATDGAHLRITLPAWRAESASRPQ